MSQTATRLKNTRRTRRKRRVRAKISGTAERPRISVVRSNRGVSAQVIDDVAGKTLASVNWTEADLRKLSGSEQATKAGELLAERVKAFAEGIREGGLTV